MAEQKKFDPVTIIGLLLAVALFMGGNFYMQAKRAQQQREVEAAQAKQDEERKREEAAHPKPPELTNGDTKPPNGNGEKLVPVSAPAEAEIPLTPDLIIKTDE